MRALSDADILATWEVGAGQHPLDRALTLLAAGLGQRRAELACLPIGQRDRGLWELRRHTWGRDLAGLINCPACGERIELRFSAVDACVADSCSTAAEHTLDVGPWSIRFRLPDSRDLAAIASCGDCQRGAAELARRCLLRAEREGEETSFADVPADVLLAMESRMSLLDPQAEVRLELSCPACEHRWQSGFDIADFVWTEVATRARRLMQEVALLARAYGWSESDILALSPARRHAYLELAAS